MDIEKKSLFKKYYQIIIKNEIKIDNLKEEEINKKIEENYQEFYDYIKNHDDVKKIVKFKKTEEGKKLIDNFLNSDDFKEKDFLEVYNFKISKEHLKLLLQILENKNLEDIISTVNKNPNQNRNNFLLNVYNFQDNFLKSIKINNKFLNKNKTDLTRNYGI